MLRIAVPDLVSNSYFPIIAAVEMGFFQARRLRRFGRFVVSHSENFRSAARWRISILSSARRTRRCLPFPEWQGAKLLAACGQHTYWFLVIRSDLHPKRGDLSVVKGLRIGAAPGVNLSLQRMLVEAGIDPEKNNVQIMPIPGAAGPNVSFGLSAAKALEEGKLDGFWANGMGCEVALRRGVGTMVLDVRRGDGPPAARHYTFSALVATEKRIQEEPGFSARRHPRLDESSSSALKEDASRATAVGEKRFPPAEAELIAELVRRDLPYYDPPIPEEKVMSMNRFAQDIGLLEPAGALRSSRRHRVQPFVERTGLNRGLTVLVAIRPASELYLFGIGICFGIFKWKLPDRFDLIRSLCQHKGAFTRSRDTQKSRHQSRECRLMFAVGHLLQIAARFPLVLASASDSL